MRTVGVDMLHFSAKPDEYRLQNAGAFMHSQTVKRYGEAPEIWGHTAEGQPLTGKLYVNRGAGGHVATVDVKQTGLQVQINPSKLLHPYELTADVSHAVEAVKKQLHEMTVDVDVHTMRLSRVDLTKQAQMQHPIEAFTGAFGALNGKRMKQRTQYGSGAFEVGNKQRHVVFYDKHREQALHDPNTTTPENLLRCEARFMKEAISNGRNGIGVGVVNDLLNVDAECLTHAYNTNLLRNVFRTSEGVQLCIDYGHEIDVLSAFLNSRPSPSKAVDEYVITAGVEHILHSFGDVSHFRQVLLNLGVNRRTAYRIEAGLRHRIDQKRMIDRTRGKKDSVAYALDTLIQTFAA
jgi:hypothetical protein